TLQVLSGTDQIQRIFLPAGGQYVETPGVQLSRLCSSTLSAPSAFFNPATGMGYDGQIITDGEDVSGGRALGHVVATGDSFQLPDLGTAAWENVVPNPGTGDKTVVAGTSDTGGGNIYIYAGTKKDTGNPVEKAVLTGGQRYAISVPAPPVED